VFGERLIQNWIFCREKNRLPIIPLAQHDAEEEDNRRGWRNILNSTEKKKKTKKKKKKKKKKKLLYQVSCDKLFNEINN